MCVSVCVFVKLMCRSKSGADVLGAILSDVSREGEGGLGRSRVGEVGCLVDVVLMADTKERESEKKKVFFIYKHH